MPKSGDYISLHDDIDPGRGTPGRNKLSDPSGGQTAVSDYTGGAFNGMKIHGYHNHDSLRHARLQFMNSFESEVVLKGTGRRQSAIFGDASQWDWQVINPYDSNTCPGYLRLLSRKGHRAVWGIIYQTPATGHWIRLRARFKDIGGINNHIPGIGGWTYSKKFRINGAEVPKTYLYTRGEDGYFGNVYTGYGLNNGQFRIKTSWPTSSENKFQSGRLGYSNLSYYVTYIYNASTGAQLGGITHKPNQYGHIYNINSGGSNGGTSKLRWTTTGYDTGGRVIIPPYGSGAKRSRFSPPDADIYYSHQRAGTGWSKDYTSSAQRPPNF